MKRTLLISVITAMSAMTATAQTVKESKFTDNWYIGVNGGMNFKTTNTAVLKNLNPSMGMRVGRAFSPVLGTAIEADVYMNNKGSEYRPLGTFIKGMNLSLLTTVNFSNWFGGYTGEPRRFEIVGVTGMGWGHVFKNSSATFPGKNVLTSKFGVDFIMNLGTSKAWQVYLEPNVTYALSDWDNKVQYDLNKSAVGVILGVNYKLGNSNGTHNFVIADVYDAEELAILNNRINDLREEKMEMAAAIDERNQTIADLRGKLRAPKTETVIIDETVDVLQPVVIFRQGNSTIDPSQNANISLVAQYMLDNSDVAVVIKGYASMEGSKQLNQRLSEKRAEAVKQVLVNRYHISEDRLVTHGYGATDKLFSEPELNRVVVFAGE